HPSEDTLQAYLDGELPSAAELDVRGHLSGCVACRGSLERLRDNAMMFTAAIEMLDDAEPAEWDEWRLPSLASGGVDAMTSASPAASRDDARRRERSHLRVVPGSAGSGADLGPKSEQRVWRSGPALRWAARITLVTVAAASAAVIAFPGLRPGGSAPETTAIAPDAASAQAGGLAGAAVAVRPLDDDVRIVLANAPAG